MLKLSHCGIGGRENDVSDFTWDNESSTLGLFEQPKRINKEKVIANFFYHFDLSFLEYYFLGGGGAGGGKVCKIILIAKIHTHIT
jgi:hypothetical protein